MASLQEIHRQSYSDMPFGEFAQKYHAKFYSDMPFYDFAKKTGLDNAPKEPSRKTEAGFSTRAARETGDMLPMVSRGEAFGRGIEQGATLNASDEIRAGNAAAFQASGLQKLLDENPNIKVRQGPVGMLLGGLTGGAVAAAQYLLPDKFGTKALDAAKQTYAVEQDRNKAASQQYPVTNFAGNIAGGVALPVGAINTARQGAAFGAGAGSIAGFMGGDDMSSRLGGAGVGAALGGGLGYGLGRLAERGAARAAQPVVNEVVQAGDIAGVQVPQGLASESSVVRRATQGLIPVPGAGEKLAASREKLVGDIQGRVTSIADEFGQGSGPNVASRIAGQLESARSAEVSAATSAAQKLDEQTAAAFEAAKNAAIARAQSGEQSALSHIQQGEEAARRTAQSAIGELNPQDMGQILTMRLKAGEEAARATKDALYGEASQASASIKANAVREVGARIASSLEADGRVVDNILTPAASRMMDAANRLSGMTIPNKAVGVRIASDGAPFEIAAVNLSGIEQTRKVLNGLSRAATNDADRAASRSIIRAFDDWLDNAFDTALYSGSNSAIDAIKSARAANAAWRQKFGYNATDDAGRILNKIATSEVTPQEAANWIIGATKVGAAGSSSRLLSRIVDATGGDEAALGAIRSGVWTRLTQTSEGVDAKAGSKVANEIYEFLNGSGRDIANRLYSQEQRNLMKAYADTVRASGPAREQASSLAKGQISEIEKLSRANAPKPTQVGVGPMQDLANTVIGKSGKTDEAVYQAIDAYAKSGGRGDIETLSRIIRAVSPDDVGALAGAIVRNLGVSPRTGQFSPEVFMSQWRSYTPQAKSLLFGNAGQHRAALEAIATISDRLVSTERTFGNPSGTARMAGWSTAAATAGAEMLSYGIPIKTLTTVLGGNMMANALSKPATASSIAKYSAAQEAFIARPTAATLSSMNIASRNLANTLSDKLGVNVTAQQLMKALSGPNSTRADDQQESQGQR